MKLLAVRTVNVQLIQLSKDRPRERVSPQKGVSDSIHQARSFKVNLGRKFVSVKFAGCTIRWVEYVLVIQPKCCRFASIYEMLEVLCICACEIDESKFDLESRGSLLKSCS